MNPRVAWLTVILIAAIGFVNYILLKLYGRRGVEIGGFLGGLVNSSVTITDLASRARGDGPGLSEVAYRGVMLSVTAMLVRNAVLLAIFDVPAVIAAAVPLAFMFLTNLGLVLAALARPPKADLVDNTPPRLQSPFSLQSALKFGLIFLGLQIAGGAVERVVGQLGFYAISFIGGLISSASAVSSAATLGAAGLLLPGVAGTGAVLASVASILVNLPLIGRVSGDRVLVQRLTRSHLLMILLGAVGVAVQVGLLGRT